MSTSSNATALRLAGHACLTILLSGVLTGMARAAATPPPLQPTLRLPNGPLNTALTHPNLLLDLSVEYPTAGSAYKGVEYSYKRLYYGYFDSTTCYTYSGTFFKPNGGKTDDKYKCNGSTFSGNFMNWASASAVDMLRLGLSGGNRVVDTANQTILERAYLRDEMYANPFLFPVKAITGASSVKPSDVTPFRGPALYMISCRNLILFSDTRTDTQDDRDPSYAKCDAPVSGNRRQGPPAGSRDKNLGQFVVQVEVCSDDIEYYNRKELCFRYPSGSIKPIGDIQKHADDLHFGVMSYLLEDGPYRYGGVLRAPLGYVGPNKYDGKLVASSNAASEWSEDTGIFNPDPLRGPYGKSGVITYLNKFGSTGRYKANDPVSEMYYESLRYLRGLDPTPLATADLITPANATSPGWVRCASNGGTCTVPGTVQVRYGAFGRYAPIKTVTGSIACNRAVFGSPNRFPALNTCEALLPGKIDMTEGFPVLTSWIDPIKTSCQRNAIVLIADSNTNFDFFVPGNTTNLTIGDGSGRVVDGPRAVDNQNLAQPLDARAWTNMVGAFEATNTKRPLLTASLGDQRNGWKNVYPPTDGEQKGSYYVAGLAYWANVSQMRAEAKKKNIHAKTFVIDVDETGNGRTANTTRRFTAPRDSQLYLAAKYGGYPAYTDDDRGHANPRLDPYLPGTNPPNVKTKCTSYLWDNNGNCDPDNYFLASDGNNFVEAIHSIIQQASLQGETASVATTSGRVVTLGKTEYIYQASATPEGGWNGNVTRSPVRFNGTSLEIGPPDKQTAAAALTEPDFDGSTGEREAGRKIYTWNEKGTEKNRSTVSFVWDALSDPQKRFLDGGGPNGPKRVAFLRGSTNDEYSLDNADGLFRRRPSIAGVKNLLGDIVNSSPVYVGAPRTDIQEYGYANFFNTKKSRAAAVYVGANDGMLHAFSAGLDKEYFAYVPRTMFEKIGQLSDKAYTHVNFVDGGITVSEAKVGPTSWKTVLVGGMGGGAQGVYALDVTDPKSFDPKNGALWEFSDADDADMGNVYTAPAIVKFRDGTLLGRQRYRHFAVVASGFNNNGRDANQSLAAPGGALFLLALDKQADAKWKIGENYFKFVIPPGVVNRSLKGGLSTPAFVTFPDGSVQVAYAGDLQGNLWRFPFPSQQSYANLTAHRIFTALDHDRNRQPITAPPNVVYAPAGGFVVLFGTGKYVEDRDLTTKKQDSFYGIYDDPNLNGYVVNDRSELKVRTIAGTSADATLVVNGKAFTYFNGATAGNKNPKGWYLDFANASESGERSITPPVAEFGKIFFNTLLPPNDVCDLRSSGRSYMLDALTGLPNGGDGASTGVRSTVGMLGTPLVFETNQGVRSQPNAIGKSVTPRKYGVANIGTKAIGSVGSHTANLPTGRLSWLEIQNFQDLKNSAGAK